ncbi:MAG: 50S ribosome-binding GTPase [Phycisphaerales bacterium]|nr:50S ribosome-binding GTPase [Phycisphaerales bacterium]
MSGPWYSILTPSDRAGAVAMIQVEHPSMPEIGLPEVGTHQLRHVDLFGLDDGVVLGVDERAAVLMPHGGIAIVRQICSALEERGVPPRSHVDPVVLYPEARSEIEAWCSHALARCASPMGVDVLLEQNKRWAASGCSTVEDAEGVGDENARLDRLLHPPLVVAVGRANVGKSSLLNALVGQRVALVADRAGTTRDHVGVPVDLGGLVVRWIDMPGVDERIEDQEEIGIALRVIEHADLVVHCIDAVNDEGVLDPRISGACPVGIPLLRVGTRADLADHGCVLDARVSVARDRLGVADMVEKARDSLIHPADVRGDALWRFWSSLGPQA